MKKFISMFLALTLFASFGVCAFAENTESSYNEEIVRESPEDSPLAAAEGFNVEVKWTGMIFTYVDAAKGKWDPKTCSYSDSKAGYWESSDTENNCGTITVTNNSTDGPEITATFSFKTNTSYTGTAIMRIAENKPNDAQAWKNVKDYLSNTKTKQYTGIAANSPKTVYVMPAIATGDDPELLQDLTENKFGDISIEVKAVDGTDFKDPTAPDIPEIFE